MAIAVAVFVGVCVLSGVATVAATMLSSRMSNAGIVVRRGPEQGAPFDEYDGGGRR